MDLKNSVKPKIQILTQKNIYLMVLFGMLFLKMKMERIYRVTYVMIGDLCNISFNL